jgi:hypothetical protein
LIQLSTTPRSAWGRVPEVVRDLRSLAIRGLRRMYRPEHGLFAFRLRRQDGQDVLEGVSRRYTATVLLSLAEEPADVVSGILAGQSAHDVCGRLLAEIDRADDLGEVALTLWAARALDHPDAPKALRRLQAMGPAAGSYPTVELAWSLGSLVVNGSHVSAGPLARAIAERLLLFFNEGSGLFPHGPNGARSTRLRAHVACFADLVYPIHALSHYYRATGDTRALDVARRCAERMCGLQGPEGQWWWHYDVRTGRVVERFPVYAVHQDAMAPLALFALQDAGGQDHRDAIERGLRWLFDPPEITGSLVDAEADVIWRKVARHEPGKLTRSAQALASRVHPALRIPGVDTLLRPGRIDYETRPYHMGWVLYAWPLRRASHPPGK